MVERLDELLSERQRNSLPQNERILWVGRTSPNFFFRGWQWWGFAAVMLSIIVWGVLVPQTVETWATFGKVVSQETKIRDVIFISPFVLFSLAVLFYPGWRWIRLRRAVWVVTDAAVYRFCWPCLREWRRSDILDRIDRIDKYNGYSDFYFADEERRNKNGTYTIHHAIENVPQIEAETVAYAFRRIAERKVSKLNMLMRDNANVNL